MVGYRWLRAVVRAALGFVAVLPVVGLAIAALVDLGPDGGPRVSPFPIALRVSADYTWTCARNSLAFAGAIAALSMLGGIGTGMAIAAVPRRGRSVARGLVASMLAAPPACLAVGWIGILGLPLPWPSPMRHAAASLPGLESWGGWPSWLLWIGSTAPPAVALVAIATARALDRVEPTWWDAARLAGAGRFRAWWGVAWPMVRPAAARAAAVAFSIALFEPGAPMVLGLRRTIPFQIVEAATGPDPFPDAAIWTTLAAVLSFAGRWLIRSMGGPSSITPPVTAPKPAAGAPIAIAAGMVAAIVPALGWLPVVGLIRILTGAGMTSGDRLALAWTPPVPQVAIQSLILGLEVGAVLLILARLARPDPMTRPATSLVTRMVGRFALVPPMVQGVGILAMLELGSIALNPSRLPASLGKLAELGPELSVTRNPWPILAAAVGISIGCRLLPGWRRAAGRRADSYRSGLVAAMAAGSSAARARALATRRPYQWIGSLALAILLPAVDLAPALLFAPWSDVRTAAPEVLLLADGGPDARLQAAALACGLIAVNLLALGASRMAPAPPSEWDPEPA